MEFFDKIGKKATEAYKVTADKTGKIAKETKLKLKISELKSQINTLYSEIGKKAYEKHSIKARGGEDTEKICDEIQNKCIEIDKMQDEIDSLEKQCLDLNDKKKCDNCNNEIEKNVKFCPHCGAEQEIVEEPEEEDKEDDNSSENAENNSEKTDVSENAEKEDSSESTEKSSSSENSEKSSAEKNNTNEAREVEVLPKEDQK